MAGIQTSLEVIVIDTPYLGKVGQNDLSPLESVLDCIYFYVKVIALAVSLGAAVDEVIFCEDRMGKLSR